MRMPKTISLEIATNGIILTVNNPSTNPAVGMSTERLVFSDEDGIEKIKELIADERTT